MSANSFNADLVSSNLSIPDPGDGGVVRVGDRLFSIFIPRVADGTYYIAAPQHVGQSLVVALGGVSAALSFQSGANGQSVSDTELSAFFYIIELVAGSEEGGELRWQLIIYS